MFGKKRLQQYKSILECYKEDSHIGVEFRRLVRSLKHFDKPKEVRSILITSSLKNEGKSLISSYLAIAVARSESNKRVLLIDFDLRQPTIHKLFMKNKQPGLSHILETNAETEDLAQRTELDNLDILTSGHHVSSPSQLLINAKYILDICMEKYDLVICDSPPVVPVDDVNMIVPHVDGVLLVVMAGKSDKMAVKRSTEILKGADANILGVVFNNLHRALPYYYDYSYYGYKYGK
jgi:capsular exopolysaccharide synthesis family protein